MVKMNDRKRAKDQESIYSIKGVQRRAREGQGAERA